MNRLNMNEIYAMTPQQAANLFQEREMTPESMIQFLKENPPTVPNEGAANKLFTVELTAKGGYFQLSWESEFLGYWDWVGLYKNSTAKDEDYIKGNNWQWASCDSPYTTSTKAESGYQARYLVWDYRDKKYKSVASATLK